MKIGDLIHIVNIDDREDTKINAGIIININPCEYMPSFHIYRFIDANAIWLYQVNISLISEA